MSQLGKLYSYYLKKIFRKNGLRISIFTLLVGVVWWFVLPWLAQKAIRSFLTSRAENATEEQKAKWQAENGFAEMSARGFGAEGFDLFRKLNREQKLEEYVKKLEEDDEEFKNLSGANKMQLFTYRASDSGSILGFSLPYTADNNFFFSQTEGYTAGKKFGKLLFDISWGNLSGFVILYGFVFEVLDKNFFSSREDGEDATVLTLTPGVKRSDLIGSKIFAFLTFYFLINVALFLIPFGIYYGGLASEKSFTGFALLSLFTTIIGPILFFALFFAPYLCFGSLIKGGKGIFSSLLVFLPMLGAGIKLISSAPGPYTVEKGFFDPVGFPIIALLSGTFFLLLYYGQYQEEDFTN